MWLHRILSEQKSCREQVRGAQYRLKHRNKAIYSADLYVRKWSDERCDGKEPPHRAARSGDFAQGPGGVSSDSACRYARPAAGKSAQRSTQK